MILQHFKPGRPVSAHYCLVGWAGQLIQRSNFADQVDQVCCIHFSWDRQSLWNMWVKCFLQSPWMDLIVILNPESSSTTTAASRLAFECIRRILFRVNEALLASTFTDSCLSCASTTLWQVSRLSPSLTSAYNLGDNSTGIGGFTHSRAHEMEPESGNNLYLPVG